MAYALESPAADALDGSKKRLGLFGNPLAQVEAAFADNASPELLDRLLTLHHGKIGSCDDPFAAPSTASRTQVQSGTVNLAQGKKVAVSDKEKEVVFKISKMLDLDEIEALVLWRQFWEVHEPAVPDHLEGYDEEVLETVTDFYFAERHSVLVVFAALLNKADEEGSPTQEVCFKCLERIAKPDMPSRFLDSFVRRTRQVLPDDIRSSPRLATKWAKALIREQKSLLEIIFLLFYGRVESRAGDFADVLQAIAITEWGQHQESYAFFDAEASAIGDKLASLLTLIAIEVARIDVAAHPNFDVLGQEQQARTFTDPTTLKQIHQLICETLLPASPQRTAPIALAWTFILYRVTESYEAGLSNTSEFTAQHRDFAEVLLPASAFSGAREMSVLSSAAEDGPFYKRLAEFVLSPACDLFGHLHALFASITAVQGRSRSRGHTSFSPGALGYLSAGRSLLACLPLLLRLPFLGEAQLAAAIDTFAYLFRLDPSFALPQDFWKFAGRSPADVSTSEGDVSMAADETPLAEAEKEYLDVVAARFPAAVGPFFKVVRALCGLSDPMPSLVNSQETRPAQAACGVATLNYLASLTTLTFAHPTPPMLVPSPYTLVGTEGTAVRASRRIFISPSVSIPEGAEGRFVSAPGQKPDVICWQMKWSAVDLMEDLVEECSEIRSSSKVPRKTDVAGVAEVFGDPSTGGGPSSAPDMEWLTDQVTIDVLSDALEIGAAITSEAFSARPEVLAQAGVSRDMSSQFVLAVFATLEKSVGASGGLLARPAQASLRLIGALVWPVPDEVWAMLRGSRILFPALAQSKVWRQNESSSSIVQREKLAGRYPVTLAVLDVIVALWEHCRSSSLTTDRASGRQVNVEVLLRAFAWVRDEVWAGFASWKYVALEDKFRIAYKCAQIFSAIGREAVHTASTPRPFDKVVPAALEAFKASFVSTANLTTLNPIMHLVAATPWTLPSLADDSRLLELETLMWAINASLELAETIFHLRRSVTGSTPCLLEHAFVTSPSREDAASGINALSHWALRPDTTGLRASRTMAMLCGLSQDWPPDWPSVLSSYPNVDDFRHFVKGLLQRAVEGLEYAPSRLPDRASAWDLLSAMADSQPAVAEMLVDQKVGDSNQSVLDEAFAFVRSTGRGTLRLDPLCASVLALLDTVMSRASDFRKHLAGFVKDDQVCSALVDILSVGSPAEVVDEDDPSDQLDDFAVNASCAVNLCCAYAARILATFIKITGPASPPFAPDSQSAAVGALEKLLSSPAGRDLLLGAISTPAHPELQNLAAETLQRAVPTLDLEDYRNVPMPLRHDRLWRYGTSFVYDVDTVGERIMAVVPRDRADSLDLDLKAVNANLSKVDSRLVVTRSWQQLLEVLLPRTATLGDELEKALASVAVETASDSRQGNFMVSVRAERIALLLTIFHAVESKEGSWVLTFLATLRDIATSDSFPLLASVRRSQPIPWHRPFMRLLLLALQKASTIAEAKTERIAWTAAQHATGALFHSVVDWLETVLDLARGLSDHAVRADVGMCVTLFSELLHHPLLPATAIQPYRIHDVCMPALSLLARMDLDGGRPIFADQIVRLCTALARSPRLVELLASEGVMTVLLNTGITAAAESGSIVPLSTDFPNEEAPLHHLWCSILALATSLTQSLGTSQQFLNEATAFASLYAHQLVSAFSTADEILSWASLKAMDASAALLYSILCRGRAGSTAFDVARMVVGPSLVALQFVRHCLTHPQSTASKLATDVTAPPPWRGSDDEGQLRQAAEVQLLRVARNILLAVTAYTRSVTVLTAEPFEWPLELAVIWPARTIVIGEPASIGTLLELAETCLDFTRTTLSSASLKDESTQVLEATLVLAVAQLALWERRPPGPPHHHDGRMRREMAELVQELLDLIEKASGGATGLGRSVGPGAAKAKGKDAEPELMQVLGMFARANLRKGD